MRAITVPIVVAVFAAAAPGAGAGADRPAQLFSYAAASAGLGSGMDVHTDGTWEATSHDHRQNRRGKLSRGDLSRFRHLLRAARFDAVVTDAGQVCESDRQVIYHDADQQRTVSVRPPCTEVDDVTGRLPTCLWALISGTTPDCDP